MLITFFAEQCGYYFDQELISVNAGYVRNSFVLASLDKYSEFEHPEKILYDALCDRPVAYSDDADRSAERTQKYAKYDNQNYEPTKHEYIE